MEFPKAWFENEVQYGFYVPSIMKRCWAASVEVLLEIDRICREHQIPWWLSGGTIIGAVRHQGHIPWDDDIDIYMTREGMDRFLEATKTELPEDWRWLVPKEIRHPLITWKLVDYWTTELLDPEARARAHGFPFMALVDFSILDPLLPDEEAEDAREELALIIQQMLVYLKEHPDESSQDARDFAEWVEEKRVLRLDPEKTLWDQLFDLLERLCVYPEYKDGGKSEMVAVFPYYIWDRNNFFPRSWFDGHVTLPFDGADFPAPIRYDDVLRHRYGDYMEIKFTGNAHEYPYFGGIEKGCEKEYGKDWFWHYTFSPDHLRNEGRAAWKGPREQAQEMFQALERIHGLLPQALSSGDAKTISDALGMCQDIAVKAGTLLEEAGSRETVAQIEAYCESVYRLYVHLLGDPEAV